MYNCGRFTIQTEIFSGRTGVPTLFLNYLTAESELVLRLNFSLHLTSPFRMFRYLILIKINYVLNSSADGKSQFDG